ncbi:hypothetical protein NC651_006067 [Populus alba x Populus x berolinensis]|nr:hypothetical protein NC651_006067 [Populus alba x Populus x berolinensis]
MWSLGCLLATMVKILVDLPVPYIISRRESFCCGRDNYNELVRTVEAILRKQASSFPGGYVNYFSMDEIYISK